MNRFQRELYRRVMLKLVVWVFGIGGILSIPFGVTKRDPILLLSSIALLISAIFLSGEMK